MELNPHYAYAWYKKGLSLGNLGSHKEAKECYDKAMELNPNDLIVWYNEDVHIGSQGQV